MTDSRQTAKAVTAPTAVVDRLPYIKSRLLDHLGEIGATAEVLAPFAWYQDTSFDPTNRYWPSGLAPASLSKEHGWRLRLCPQLIVSSTRTMSDDDLEDYLQAIQWVIDNHAVKFEIPISERSDKVEAELHELAPGSLALVQLVQIAALDQLDSDQYGPKGEDKIETVRTMLALRLDRSPTLPSRTPLAEGVEALLAANADIALVTNGTVPLGTFSFRALAQSLLTSHRKADRSSSVVDDYLERPRFVRPSAALDSATISTIDEFGAVVVGDETHAIGLITPRGVAAHLHSRTRPVVVVMQIEQLLRHLIEVALGHELVLKQAIARALEQLYSKQSRAIPTRLKDLTLGEQLDVVKNKENWAYFEPILGVSRQVAATRLDRVRDIRNELMHLRDAGDGVDLEDLESIESWIASCYRAVAKTMKHEAPSDGFVVPG